MLSGEGKDVGIRAVLGVGNDEVLSKEEVDELIAGDGKGLEDVEMLLVGTVSPSLHYQPLEPLAHRVGIRTWQGHSAWGEFVLRGRVRIWDGMVCLALGG